MLPLFKASLFSEPCPDPGRLHQGDRIGDDFRHGKLVTFTCPRDYVMEGVRTITCSDGRWSNEKPSCKGDFCLSGLVDGFLITIKPIATKMCLEKKKNGCLVHRPEKIGFRFSLRLIKKFPPVDRFCSCTIYIFH